MARYSKFHLQKVGSAFRYRRRIPTALIPILDGKPEWSKYLGQLGERDAIVEARKLDVEHDAVIARVGKPAGANTHPTNAESARGRNTCLRPSSFPWIE